MTTTAIPRYHAAPAEVPRLVRANGTVGGRTTKRHLSIKWFVTTVTSHSAAWRAQDGYNGHRLT